MEPSENQPPGDRRIDRHQASAPTRAAPFQSNDDVLQTALHTFAARGALQRTDVWRADDETMRVLRAEERAWSDHLHESLKLTEGNVSFADHARRHSLNEIECEILLVLVLSQLGLTEEVNTCSEMLACLSLPRSETILALRALMDGGRLYRAGLISYEDPDEDIRDRAIVTDSAIVESMLTNAECHKVGWPVETEADLYAHMGSLTRALYDKCFALDNIALGYGLSSEFLKYRRRASRLLTLLDETLTLHRDWKLNRLRATMDRRHTEWVMLVALLGKELGHMDAGSDLFKGVGLARAASYLVDDVRKNLECLMIGGSLTGEDWVRPCNGLGQLLSSDPREIEQAEFELTDKAMEMVALEKRILKNRKSQFEVREARVTMDQLVLSGEVQRAINMTLTHVCHSEKLLIDWGLSDAIPYGANVTLLFSGPPGTGKTACAEALAHELRKPILVANYAEIQNCYVGMTEKNTVKTFREARAHDALLFWDEADAMFYDRDSSHRNWEVRDVNVLLQELERFGGTCVLATNRKITLDKALERRIAVKVQFERPDRKMRRAIWQKLLPKKMPIAGDVSLDRLAEADLSGGEIKNVVLNAARLALDRNGKGPVTMDDFLTAIDMEARGKWSGESRSALIGFVPRNGST